MTTASKKKVKGIAASNSSSAQVSSTPKRGGNKRNFKNTVKFTESTINEQFSLQSTSTTPIKDNITSINNIDESITAQEYSVGSYIIVEYRDGSHRVAKIIQRTNNNSTASSNSQSETKLYVHYNDFNRRMDEWIDLKRVISIASPEQQTDNVHGHNNTATTSSLSDNDGKGNILLYNDALITY